MKDFNPDLEKSNSNLADYDTQISKVHETEVSSMADVPISEALVHNDIIVPLLSDNDAIINGDMDLFLKSILNQLQVKLALSEDINDVEVVFKQIDENIGKTEFIAAVMISYIHDERLWFRYGYPSMDKFLDDLPGVCKITRQTFTNAAQAGMVIRYLSSPNPIITGSGLGFELTPASLHKNYSKIKFLYRILFVWGMYLSEEVLVNFLNMTYRDFENFMKEYEVKYQPESEKLGKCSRASSERSSKTSRPKPQPVTPPELNEQETTICREIRQGHVISYLFSTDPACAESVVQFLDNARKLEYHRIWKRYHSPSEVFYKDSPNTYLSDMDWAELFPGCLIRSVARLTDLCLDLAPHEVKNTLMNAFKTQTELTLAQAVLISRMENGALHQSVRDYLHEHQIAHQHNPVMDFAINALDISISRYKWLKRIGETLPFLAKLKGKVLFTSEGFLEKLSYLRTAIDRHSYDLGLVVDALNTTTVKRFREFASDMHDNLSNDPITMKEYENAKPFIEKMRSLHAGGKSVSIIGLQSEGEQTWIDSVNRAMEHGNEHLQKRYPGIVWDSNFHVEHSLKLVSGSSENKVLGSNLTEDSTTDDLNSGNSNLSMEKAA